jgi:endonuclease/exonuclease/phosphatase (EEP) superfamily protein YafD
MPASKALDLLVFALVVAVGLTAGSALLADRAPAFALIEHFSAPALALAVAVAPLAFVTGRRWASLLLVAGGGALFLNLQPQWFPPSVPAAPDARPTRVYFANVWARNDRMSLLEASIEEADADVVALVEVSEDHQRMLPVLLDEYPYLISGKPGRPDGAARILIASRVPVRVLGRERADGLSALEVLVRSPGAPFRLIVVHTTRPWPFDRPGAQAHQLERVKTRLFNGAPERTLLVGDFNATPSTVVLERFAQQTRLRPAPAVIGTWPSVAPGPLRIGIDNAFVGSGLTVVSRRVGAPNGSDHRPVVVTVAPALTLTPAGLDEAAAR